MCYPRFMQTTLQAHIKQIVQKTIQIGVCGSTSNYKNCNCFLKKFTFSFQYTFSHFHWEKVDMNAGFLFLPLTAKSVNASSLHPRMRKHTHTMSTMNGQKKEECAVTPGHICSFVRLHEGQLTTVKKTRLLQRHQIWNLTL